MRIAGIMSGTSLDGIDVAIADVEGARVRTVAGRSTPYPGEVREAILAVSDCDTHTREIARLHFLLAELYAEAVKSCCESSGVAAGTIELAGLHGQTIFHEGTPAAVLGRHIASTLQIGDGSVLAERMGIPVVSDFRPRDIAAGGQGAPLVPFVDWLLFRDAEKGRVLLNVGGIANITVLPPGCPAGEVLAFDTGPGNMVIDALAAHFTAGRQACDRDGEMAAQGAVDPALLDELLRDDFYFRRPPKSAGREQYGRAFTQRLLAAGLPPADLMATATHLTAASIADAIYRFALEQDDLDEVIVSGGGVHNATLLDKLRVELPDLMIVTSDEYGVDPDLKEAIAFAVLAHETWHKRPGNLPSATGAAHPAVLGKISY
jgi:anhydro-N-acetylmuramic acid kinase